MKIDLHVHTSERSPCGKASQEEQIRRAIEVGLDAIAFTDHSQLAPDDWIEEINEIFFPFTVFRGIEISLAEDFLVIGMYDRELELAQWTYPELHKFVHDHGGYIILAHPFRFHPKINEDIANIPPDGIEIYSTNTPISWQTQIRQIAVQNKITLFSNSDAHQKEYIGQFYNEIPGSPKDDQELVRILKNGDVRLNNFHPSKTFTKTS